MARENLLNANSNGYNDADAIIAQAEGLLKGSTNQLMEISTRIVPAERPKTLRKLRNVYENVTRTTDVDNGLSILSPFDEQEEWKKISEIMATFNTGFLREGVLASEMEKEIQARLGVTPQKSIEESPKSLSEVGKWLDSINLLQYESTFLNNGYDHIDFLNGVLDAAELDKMGVTDQEHVKILLEKVTSLPARVAEVAAAGLKKTIETWLDDIHLNLYRDVFRKHMYVDMERIARVWEVELNAVLEIDKCGHRKRILVSVNAGERSGVEPSLEDLTQLNIPKPNPVQSQPKDESKEKTSTTVTSGTGTLRHSHKKNRPAPPPPTSALNGKKQEPSIPAPDLEIRSPSELLVGVPATLTTQWRHRPEQLVSGNITYVANYLGSTVVKELKGTESTKKSIQKLKKNTNKELTSTPGIVLEISYRGVKFLTASAREPVCEHEIRNIHCACQDADDLTHFAYITKDHVSRSHYCHVFCVDSMDQATEVILTLGQAFEVAYQMALRDQFTGNRSHGNGHTRSQSANLIHTNTANSHSRSLSVNEVKVNGTNGAEGNISPSGKAPLVLNEDL